ncbi:MAG: toxin VasX [Pseudomonadota bacterium]
MGTPAASKKDAVLSNATQAAGGKPVCDPNAPCQACQRADLQLLVVVPSVLANKHKDDVDLAKHGFSPAFDAEFVGMARKGTVPVTRIMKQGFVYVFYLERNLWDVWQVAPSGLTRKIMHQVNTKQYATLQPGFSGVQDAKSCSRGAANVPAQLISIAGAQSANEVWLAYSSDAWTSHTLQRYADNPEVEVPGSGSLPVKRKLRDVRGRQINATKAADGKLQPFSLPLNTAALEHNVLDFAAKVSPKLMDGCGTVMHPMDAARCGMATKFEGEVRALERALGQGLKKPEKYANTTSILMLPDGLGVAEAHTHINAATTSEHQLWEAGGPDATGANKNPGRPWARQSLIQAGFICDWVAATEKRKADEVWGPNTKFNITPAMYGFYIDKRGTERRVVPDSTRYEYNSFFRHYDVYLPLEEKKKRSDALAAAGTAKKIARYKKHLDNGAIEEANAQWKKQEDGWTDLKKKRDQDYIDWLQTSAFGAAVRYDFDDHRAVSDANRDKAQILVDAQEAATRLRVMARCFGGAGCSEVSADYFARQFWKEVTDPTHYIAQAMMGEFNFTPKLIDKLQTDAGARADIYDAYLASTNSFKEFRNVWQSIGVPPVSDTSTLLLMVTTINARLRLMALQPGMQGKKGVAKALERASTRSAMWFRSQGLINFINTNQKQYLFSVALAENSFHGATIHPTLVPGIINVDRRPDNVTGKQAADGRKLTRAEINKQIATSNARGLGKFEAATMILCDQDDLIKLANMRQERLVAVVSPGLFGLHPKVVEIPESWVLEMTNRQKHLNLKNLVSKSGGFNLATLIFQGMAFDMSWGDVNSSGGYDQMDAAGSLLGAGAGILGGLMELGSMIRTPGALNKMGTPFAAELASKVPAHLWLKFGSGLCLAAGAIFDSSVAYAKYRKAENQGDDDAKRAYAASAAAEFSGGISLGVGAYYAYRASQLDRLGQVVARQAVVRILGGAFSPILLARCLTGVGLILWLGGLGFSFLAMYLEDDDNEVFLKRSHFGKGHPELGRFNDLDHEVKSFGSLSTGTRAELEWNDKWGDDEVTVIVKVFKPEKSTVVTVRLDGYDKINGKHIRFLTAGKLPPLKLSKDKAEAATEIFTTELALDMPDEVSAVKVSYYVYPSAVKGTEATATGDLWIED